jgi:hypothetical protein
VSLGLAVIGVAVVAGALIAVSALESRVAILGLVLALVAAPLVTAGPPAPLPLAVRLVAAILAGYLLWVAVRPVPARTAGSRLGWPAELLLAGTAAVVGWAALDGPGVAAGGPREAGAAALAVGVLALGPLLGRADALQMGIGAALAITATELLRVGVAGAPSPLEELSVAVVVVAAAGAAALLARAAVVANGSLDVTAHRAAAARPAAGVAEPQPQPAPRLASRPRR